MTIFPFWPWRRASHRHEQLIALLIDLSRKVSLMTQTLADFQATATEKLAKLQADVAAQTTVFQSAVTLLNGQGAVMADMRAQIAALTAAGVDASVLQPVLDAIDAQSAALEGSTADLAAAVTANTPAAAIAGDTTTTTTGTTATATVTWASAQGGGSPGSRKFTPPCRSGALSTADTKR